MFESLTSQVGAFALRHRLAVAVAWAVFVVIAGSAGLLVDTAKIESSQAMTGEAAVAQRLIDAHPSKGGSMTESVVVKAPRAGDARLATVVTQIAQRLEGHPGVVRVVAPTRTATASTLDHGTLAADGRTVLLEYELRLDADPTRGEAEAAVAPVVLAISELKPKHADFAIDQFGPATVSHALSSTIQQEFKRAEWRSLVVAGLILILSFGALVAAGVPLLLAFSAVLATIGLCAVVSHVFAADPNVNSVVLLMGMAVGVDYSLFFIHRFREERTRGRSNEDAVERAIHTSGHAILVSGVTVAATMAGMLIIGFASFTSIAVASMLVVVVAIVASVTVLPVVLSLIGDHVDRGGIPYLGALSKPLPEHGATQSLWGRVLAPVLQRPWTSIIVAGALLVALALPALRLHTELPTFADLPSDLAVVRADRNLQEAFGSQNPARVAVVTPDVTTKEVTGRVEMLRKMAIDRGFAREPIGASTSIDKQLIVLDVPIVGNGRDERSRAALAALREQIVPATVGTLPQAQVAVAGTTAEGVDFKNLMSKRFPAVLAFVVVLCFLLMLVAFRSVVIPIKTIALNLLSVGASYGALVLIFQDGHGERLLGFTSTGSITAWVPVYMFVVLFGLSMDYHIFVLTRVKELVDAGSSTRQAVELGIQQTAGVVTRAAVIMIGVFAAFASLRTIDFKQLAVGMAIAIALDATIVRCVLLPATMMALDDLNWYLPKWLSWLPGASQQDVPTPTATPALPLPLAQHAAVPPSPPPELLTIGKLGPGGTAGHWFRVPAPGRVQIELRWKGPPLSLHIALDGVWLSCPAWSNPTEGWLRTALDVDERWFYLLVSDSVTRERSYELLVRSLGTGSDHVDQGASVAA